MRALILGLLMMAAPLAQAQKNGSFFSVETEAGKALRVSDIEAEVKVNGAFAESTLDMAFYNDSIGNLQGLFNIQLPQGALVRDFALRIGEKWHYGSLTEKHKARETFEEIVRAGADPAVLAWKDGAEYQVRIFPFPAKGKRWVRIHYWQDLTQVKDKFVYSLPLPKLKVDHFRLKFTAQAESLSAMKVSGGFEKHVYMKAGEDKSGFGSMIDERGFTIPGEFRVSFDQNGRTPVWTAMASPKGDGNYGAVRFLTPLEDQPRQLAKRILIFADTSRSAMMDNKADLQAFVQNLKTKAGGAEISLYEFDADVRKVSQLGKSQYDGGTNFAAVFEEIRRQQKIGQVDAILITDAVPTMQKESDFAAASFNGARLYFTPPKTRFNPHFAALIADKSGGAVLPSLTEFDSLWKAFSTEPWRYKTIAAENGSATEIFPEQGSAVDRDEGVFVYFRSKNGKVPSAITVTLTGGGKTKELRAELAAVKTVPQAESLWAMKKLFSLVGQAEEYEKDLAAHATRYKLVSPKTSYIVLENDWDYQRFNISKREDAPAEAEMESQLSESVASGSADASFLSAAAPQAEPAAAPRGALAKQQEAPLKAKANKGLGGSGEGSSAGSRMERKSIRHDRNEPSSDQQIAAARRVPPYYRPGSMVKLADAKHQFTKAYWSVSQIDEAYTKSNNETMTDAWFFVEFANALAGQGQKERARRVLSNLFEISTEDGRALRTLGLLGCQDGNCEWAIKAFELAIELRPEEPQNYRDLAWVQAEAGRLNEAKATLLRLKGKKFHGRFPGMDQLLERELAFLESLMAPQKDKSVPPTYTWITWNNDNSDADFHIEEDKETTISYRNHHGKGSLTNDFTRGYGPEIYSATKTISPKYLVNYYRADPSSASGGLVVKFARIERADGGKVKIKSQVFPLYRVGDFVTVEN